MWRHRVISLGFSSKKLRMLHSQTLKMLCHCAPALKKMQVLFEKLEHGVYNLSRLRESATKRYNAFHIPTDWMLDSGYVSQLANHGIPEELLERVKKVCSECFEKDRKEGFNNSEPVKMLNDLVEKKSGDKLENVDWEDVFLLSDDNEWPLLKTPRFKETMTEYRSELRKLGEKVMEAMDENLGLPKGYIKKAFNGGDGEKAFFGTKVSHYPPCPHPDKVIGLRAHTDAGGVILLYQDDKVGGLQILKDGQWIDVQPMPNSIVINTGDQIEVLSNGRYKSVWHRVLTKPDGNRRSIASFYNPSLEATIAPAKELVMEKVNHEEDEEVAYPKFVFGDYMSIYAEQKFLPKEPRFLAVKTM